MSNRDNSIGLRERYDFAFRLGLVGTIVLGALSLTSASLTGLLALAAWTLATMFVLPPMYDWLHRGSHQ